MSSGRSFLDPGNFQVRVNINICGVGLGLLGWFALVILAFYCLKVLNSLMLGDGSVEVNFTSGQSQITSI